MHQEQRINFFGFFFESLFPNKSLDSTDSGRANRHRPPSRHQVTWQYDRIYHPQHCDCIAPKKVKLHFSTQKHGFSDDFIHLLMELPGASHASQSAEPEWEGQCTEEADQGQRITGDMDDSFHARALSWNRRTLLGATFASVYGV